jgi:hypothetical protein
MTETQLLPVVWTLASMALAVLATLFIGPARLAQLRLSRGGRFLDQFLRLLYFIGLPYAALLTRAIAPIDMGLSGAGGPLLGWTAAEWLRGAGTALTVGLLVLIPIGWASRQMAKAGLPVSGDHRSIGSLVSAAIYSEIHWAFYRAAPLILLAEVYGAALIGAMLVALEWLVVLMRNGFSSMPAERQLWLRQIVFLAMSATLFILTQNVWLIVGLRVVSEVLLKIWLAHSARLLESQGETLSELTRETLPDPDVRPLHERPSA